MCPVTDLTHEDSDTDRGDPERAGCKKQATERENTENTAAKSDSTLESHLGRRVRVMYATKSLRKRKVQPKDLSPFLGTVVDLRMQVFGELLIKFDDRSSAWVDPANKKIFSFVD